MIFFQEGLNNFESDENGILLFYCWAQRHSCYENMAKYLRTIVWEVHLPFIGVSLKLLLLQILSGRDFSLFDARIKRTAPIL